MWLGGLNRKRQRRKREWSGGIVRLVSGAVLYLKRTHKKSREAPRERNQFWFLPRDARCYAERGYATVCHLSVRPSVTFRYRDHIGWNTWKTISRPNSLRFMLGLSPTWAIWCNGNTPKIRVK